MGACVRGCAWLYPCSRNNGGRVCLMGMGVGMPNIMAPLDPPAPTLSHTYTAWLSSAHCIRGWSLAPGSAWSNISCKSPVLISGVRLYSSMQWSNPPSHFTPAMMHDGTNQLSSGVAWEGSGGVACSSSAQQRVHTLFRGMTAVASHHTMANRRTCLHVLGCVVHVPHRGASSRWAQRCITCGRAR